MQIYQFLFIFTLLSMMSDFIFVKQVIKFYRYRDKELMSFSFKIFINSALMFLLLLVLNAYGISSILWYCLTACILFFGLNGALPSTKNLYGIKLSEDIFFQFYGPQDVLVTFKGKQLNIYAERSALKHDKVVRMENPMDGIKYFLPPNQNEQLVMENYKQIIDLLADYYRKKGYKIEN